MAESRPVPTKPALALGAVYVGLCEVKEFAHYGRGLVLIILAIGRVEEASYKFEGVAEEFMDVLHLRGRLFNTVNVGSLYALLHHFDDGADSRVAFLEFIFHHGSGDDDEVAILHGLYGGCARLIEQKGCFAENIAYLKLGEFDRRSVFVLEDFHRAGLDYVGVVAHITFANDDMAFGVVTTFQYWCGPWHKTDITPFANNGKGACPA